MSTAKVDSIDALKTFRAQLFKFAENAGVALADVESEIRRTINWLENEQQQKWTGEHRKRIGLLVQAKEKLRMKKIFTGPAGSKQSTVDEERVVQKMTKLVVEAEQKMVAIKSWSRRMQKELLVYKGQTQRFATSTTVDIPLAAAVLGNMISRLELYASLAPANAKSAVGAAGSAAGGSGEAGMARPDGGDAAIIAAAFAGLRAGTPASLVRAAAPVEPLNLNSIKLQTIEESDLKTLAGLPGVAPIDAGTTIVISGGIVDHQRLYLERPGSSGPGDSGWFIGPAEVGANPFVVSVPLQQILDLRPEWAAIFALPLGSLIILDAGVVAAVLDSSNKDLWADATMTNLVAADPAPTDQPDVATQIEAIARATAAAESQNQDAVEPANT